MAAANDHSDVVDYLLRENKAVAGIWGDKQNTALDLAMQKGHLDVIRILGFVLVQQPRISSSSSPARSIRKTAGIENTAEPPHGQSQPSLGWFCSVLLSQRIKALPDLMVPGLIALPWQIQEIL